MSELEFGGMKFRGGKLFTVLTALSMLGGAAWGSFEFYNDYRNMKKKIDTYIAPDLSGINERISLIEEKFISVQDSVTLGTDYTRDIKNDLKADIQLIEIQVDRVSTKHYVKLRLLVVKAKRMYVIVCVKLKNVLILQWKNLRRNLVKKSKKL
jgi:hypothetical protein